MKLPEATIQQLLSLEFCVETVKSDFINRYSTEGRKILAEMRNLDRWYFWRPRFRDRRKMELFLSYKKYTEMFESSMKSLYDTYQFIQSATGVDEEMNPISFEQIKRSMGKE